MIGRDTTGETLPPRTLSEETANNANKTTQLMPMRKSIKEPP
jgi:hypothetical protein